MTKRYPGGYITKTPPTVSTTSAPGIWTMEQQAAYQKAGTWPFGGPFNYIEDVFSTWLYTGTGASQTHTNNIDLAGKGGLVWLKRRNGVENHYLQDSSSSFANSLSSNTTAASIVGSGVVTSVSSTGFTTSSVSSGTTYASWTFRKQPKFFDVVTYTGNDVAGRTVSHNLGAVPGVIIVKSTSAAGDWAVYHRSLGATQYTLLNSTAAAVTDSSYWQNTTPTSTEFTLGGAGRVNYAGRSYVAYLFAHDAGGFGLTGTDNVISCGSYTGNGSATGPVVTLGYEPQWLMIKNATTAGDGWVMFDNMRGMPVGNAASLLIANTSEAESQANRFSPTATGFQITTGVSGQVNTSGNTYIYIAIRRGPMKTPTSGTSVFSPNAIGAVSVGTPVTTNFPVDLQIATWRGGASSHYFYDRLRGVSSTTTEGAKSLLSDSTAAETSPTTATRMWGNTGYQVDTSWSNSVSIFHNFRRAPGFFDEVCYTGTGSARTVTHNLGVAPEMMIVKNRTSAQGWAVYTTGTGNTKGLSLEWNGAAYTAASFWNNTSPTSTVFTVNTAVNVNELSSNLVAYLFASCPGVSKVGSYSGTGATQTISCGFAARFVLIKRTDSTGDWFVWDTARGMVAGTDPRLALNSTAAESNANWVYTDASGFQIVTTDATVNASGGSYIYLAIA